MKQKLLQIPYQINLVESSIIENENSIIELNHFNLYNLGEDSNGVKLGYYTPFTIAYKKSKGQRYDHITLQDTKQFYRSFAIEIRNNELWILSNDRNDDKIRNIVRRFGAIVLGLQKKDIEKVQKIILPTLIEKIREFLRK